MLASIVCETSMPTELMLVRKSTLDSTDAYALLRCFMPPQNRRLRAFEKLRLAAQGLIKDCNEVQSKLVSKGEISEIGYFDCCKQCVVRIQDGSLVEEITGEPISDIIGTFLTESMSYDDVIHFVRSEGDLIDEFQLIFKMRSGQIIELGPTHGEWRCLGHV